MGKFYDALHRNDQEKFKKIQMLFFFDSFH